MKTQLYAIGNPEEFLARMRKIIKEEITSSLKDHKNENDEENDYIKIDQACKLLRLSRPAIYDRIKHNLLPVYKEGRNTFFRKSEVLRLINPSSTNKNK